MSGLEGVKPLYEAQDLAAAEELLKALTGLTFENYDSPGVRLTAAICMRKHREQGELAALKRLALKLGIELPEGVA
jgi:glucosamine 6-phosphate synthetase-like amidotransferase/phosphosugar isomerase protein